MRPYTAYWSWVLRAPSQPKSIPERSVTSSSSLLGSLHAELTSACEHGTRAGEGAQGDSSGEGF
jgi:hypothetical protein